MSTPNELAAILQEARNMLNVNSGALLIVGAELNIMSGVRPGIAANKELIDRIDEALASHYVG